MSTLLTVLIVIVSLLLMLVVLIQNPKGGGLASGFTGAQQLGGVQRTTDVLEKSTWGLVIALMVLSIASASFSGTGTIAPTGGEGTLEQNIEAEPSAMPAAPAPAQDASGGDFFQEDEQGAE